MQLYLKLAVGCRARQGRIVSEINGYTAAQVTCEDGTTNGYRVYGSGPGLVLVHGATQTSHNSSRRAELMATTHTVFGAREMSGLHGSHYYLAREREDVEALQKATGATDIFGLSSGAIVALETARANPGPAVSRTV